LDNQWHVKVSVLDIKPRNQWAQDDMLLVKSVVKYVKFFSIGLVSGAHAADTGSEEHQRNFKYKNRLREQKMMKDEKKATHPVLVRINNS